MDRVFLDANVLFSAAYKPASGLKRLWMLARKNKLVLMTSAYAVEEARRNLTGAARITALEKLLRQVEVGAAPSSVSPLTESYDLPAKDMPILQAAVSMKATHLLTGDFTHFEFIYGRTVEGVLVMAPGAYLRDK